MDELNGVQHLAPLLFFLCLLFWNKMTSTASRRNVRVNPIQFVRIYVLNVGFRKSSAVFIAKSELIGSSSYRFFFNSKLH